jgi:site-specific DNA recombinase
MRTVLYARKSTESDDRQVQSLEDQISALKRIAEYEGLEIVEIIKESKSAKAPGKRPEFNRMIGMIYAGEVEGILTWAINRLSRNPVDGGQLAYMLQTKQLSMIRTADRTYLPDDNALLLSIENGISTAYLQDLSRNVTRGMQGKIERGWCTCKAPLGYLNNPITREIDTDPQTFDIVQTAWRKLLLDQLSIMDLYRFVLSTGLTISSRHGQPRQPSKVMMYSLFRNPFYCGKILYKGQVYPGKHEPMISPGEFSRAQEILSRSGSTAKRLNSKFPYSGVFLCEECGCNIVGEKKFKVFRTTGRTVEYIYYHCSGHKGCSKISVRQRDITSQLEEMIQAIKIPREFGGWLKSSLGKALSQKQLESDIERETKERKLSELEQKQRRLTLMKLNGEIANSHFQELRAELEAEMVSTKSRIQFLSETRSRIIHFGHFLIDCAIEAGELPSDRSNLGILGGIARKLGNHTVSKGILNLGPHEFYKKVALFEPSVLAPEAPKSGDFVPSNSIWWSLIDDLLSLLEVAAMQQIESSVHGVRR